jgi:hypothetical protein
MVRMDTGRPNPIMTSCGYSPVVVQNVLSLPSMMCSAGWEGSVEEAMHICAPLWSKA